MSAPADAPVAATAPTRPVRDRADKLRQLKLVVTFGLVTALVLWMALSIDDPNVLYLNAPLPDKDHQPEAFNGLRLVWIALVICAAALVAAVANVIPRNAWSAVIFGAVGLAFYMAFTIWYYADQTGVVESWIVNPLPSTLKYCPPLVLGALAGVICERAGVINIAIEAQLLMGAFFGWVIAAMAYSNGAGLVAAALAGVVVALVLGLFSLRYHVDQVVVGVVLIALALGLTTFLKGQIPTPEENKDLSTLLSDSPDPLAPIEIPGLSSIPVIGRALFNQSILVYIALLAPFVVWFLLYQTRWGLRVRAVGEHPKAADTVGIRVNRVRWQAITLGGALAGLGGAFFTVGSSTTFNDNASNGQGFMALAAVIMGRWHPVGATMAALFFALTAAMKDDFGLVTKVPSQLIAVAPYLATLIAVAGFVGRVRPPAADGEPYVKD
ncbi:ABC transporter permease [Nocardioides jensenii]|uniref:ABC transporter permease n=1 Tax=Nocardioides jensenii TaxID=1843 RepID=UPI000835D719|nr:ABC transporter permease [Nocardioides jensenii]